MKKVSALILMSLLISCEQINLDTLNSSSSEPASCLDHLNKNPASNNGNYFIDHDSNPATAKVEAYCDMSGGGYTQILGDASSFSQTNLANFCNISNVSSFYTDSTYGIGWGDAVATGGANPNPTLMECILCENISSFTEVKVTLGADANVAGNQQSYGYLYIDDKDNTNYSDTDYYVSMIDAWGNDSWAGNRIYANGVIVQNNVPNVNTVDFEATINQSGRNLRICMSGETPGVYNRRYIKNLKFK